MITKEELIGEWTVSDIELNEGSINTIEKANEIFSSYSIIFGSQSFQERGDNIYPKSINVNDSEGIFSIENDIISICDNSIGCFADKDYLVKSVNENKTELFLEILPKTCCTIYNEIKSFKFIRK